MGVNHLLAIPSFAIREFEIYPTYINLSSPLCTICLQALEEVEKNFVTMRLMLCGDGEVEPNMDQVSQLTLETCKEDVISLLIHNLPLLGWEVSYHDPYIFHMFSEHYTHNNAIVVAGKERFSSLLVDIIKAKG